MYIFYVENETKEVKCKEVEGFKPDEFVLGKLIYDGKLPVCAYDKETADKILKNYTIAYEMKQTLENMVSDFNYKTLSNDETDDDVYYKIYLCDDDLFRPVCLQWFDEFDYDNSKFVKNNLDDDIVLYNESDAKELSEWLNQQGFNRFTGVIKICL